MRFLRLVKIAGMLVLAVSTFSLSGCSNQYKGLDLSIYQYRDTRNLVEFTYKASLRIKAGGLKSLEYFKSHRSEFKKPNYYLYIYDMNGINLFHAGMKSLEGKNMENVTDKDGKKIYALIVRAINDKNNPHGWVHYTWWKPGKFYPVPKSSCNFKVKTPEGKEVFVGAGLSYPHEEKEFIRIAVDDADQLLKEQGHKALKTISDPTSQYTYRDVKVFVFYPDGKPIISPVINRAFPEMSLLQCADEVGNRPFAQAAEELKTRDSTWKAFMAKTRYKRSLVKKCLYLKKTKMDKKTVLVGAITDLPEPPWID